MKNKLVVRSVPIDDLHHDPANARAHGARNLEAIRSSIREFGQVEPLVVQEGTGRVIGGNGRLQVMREMGFTHVNVVDVGVDDFRATMLGITLNRSAELADWDYEVLSKLLGTMREDMDLGALGWADYELDPLLAAEWVPPDIVDDEVPPPPPGGSSSSAAVAYMVPEEGAAVVDKAIAMVRSLGAKTSASDGEALVVVCERFLNL